MKDEYDFSNAEQGRFYRPLNELEIPVYLDRDIESFFYQKASGKNITLEKVVNTILRNEMDLLKKIG